MAKPATEGEIREIYRETIDGLYGYVSRRCGGDRALAEDITQDAWLRAVREWTRRGVPDRPIAWLTTVSRNLLFNQFRRRQPVSLDALTADDVLEAADAGLSSESAQIAAVVNHALARLSDQERDLLEAFHFERRSVAQIAEASALSERAVEGRLRRARQNLRRELTTAMNAAGATT